MGRENGGRVARGVLLLGVHLLAACAGPGTPEPRALRAGADACESCHMTADDPTLAAQFVERSGRVRIFDEPGCLVAWLREHPQTEGTAFLGDAAGSGWVSAAEAALVRGGGRTGMGYDLVAFRSGAEAEARARETGGTVTDWATVLHEGVEHDHRR